MRKFLIPITALAIFFVSVSVWAQSASLIRYNEGPGIKLTETLEFHPGVSIEGRFDSNVMYGTSTNAIGSGLLAVQGHINLATISGPRAKKGVGERKFAFQLKSAVSFREYFDDNSSVKAQRAVETVTGLSIGWIPNSLLQVKFSDDFSRSVAARNEYGPLTIARDVNMTGLTISFAPGGGRLGFGLGYGLSVDFYEDPDFTYNNTMRHGFDFTLKWKALPKTALVLFVAQGIVHYYNPQEGDFAHSGSYPFRAMAGLSGLITPFLSISLRLGYGSAFYSEGPSYSSFLASLQGSFTLGPFASLSAGFTHGFSDSIFGNYFVDEYAFIRYDHAVFRRLLIYLTGSYTFRRYNGLPTVIGVEAWDNYLVSLSTAVDYRIQEWIYIGVGYDLQLRGVPVALPTTTDLTGINDYVKHQVFGKVGVSY